MPTPVPYPYVELELGKDGAMLQPPQLQALKDVVSSRNITDLFVISHGWNNDMDDARDLYGRLFGHVLAQVPGVPGVAQRRFAVGGILWPSKKFADKDLIPGGSASLGDDATADQVILEQIDTLEELLGDEADSRAFAEARKRLPVLADDSSAQIRFAQIFLGYLPTTMAEEGDPHIPPDPRLATVGDATLLDQLGRPVPLQRPLEGDGGGIAALDHDTAVAEPAGGSAGIGDLFSGIKAGAMHLLNYVTYYKMKDRAGVVGRNGVNRIVGTVGQAFPALRLHLVGHSFGGRVVTSAVAGGGTSPAVDVQSMSLLQAAFSHFGFAQKYDRNDHDGFFRRVVTEAHVKGPLLITHTRQDTAVGIAYTISSRIAGQIAAAIGDANDPYGGLGSNGAQKTPEAIFSQLQKAGTTYPPFVARKVYNLKSDGLITGHSDITNDAVAYAILTAVAAT